MAKLDLGPTIKSGDRYKALRRHTHGQDKRMLISTRKEPGGRGGRASRYERWAKDELEHRAAEMGIQGRSSMDKAELIEALRNH